MKIIRPTAITDSAGSFTRSTTATYFDKDGILQTAAINTPRVTFSYDVALDRWKCAGVLIEPARTNYILQSQALNTAPWTGTCSVTSSGTMFGVTAWAIAKTTTGTSEAETQSLGAAVVGEYYIATVALTSGTATSLQLGLYGNTSVWANPDSGAEIISGPGVISSGLGTGLITVSSLDATIPTIVKLYRKYTTTETAALYFYPGSASNNVIGTSIRATLVQVERTTSSTPSHTSYIPTTTIAVTRQADTVTGTGFIYSNIAENDYPAWNAGTAYVITPTPDRVIRTTATTHAVYERVVAGTTPTAPENDAVNWIRVGPTNRWAAFDDSPSTLSTNTEYLTYILKPGAINSIALLELEGTEVAINLYADGEQQYFGYNDLLNTENIGNWYEYFYEPFYYQTNLALSDLVNASLLDLPQYGDTILCITVRKAGSTAKVGVIATGLVYELGKTQNGMSVGIVDYSKKDTDTYGNTVLVRRKFSRRIRATFFLYSSKVDVVANLLTQYRATPVVWIGADANYSSLVVYGFYRDWDIGIPNNIGSSCSIEIEGLA